MTFHPDHSAGAGQIVVDQTLTMDLRQDQAQAVIDARKKADAP
jgi:hypothetical protein